MTKWISRIILVLAGLILGIGIGASVAYYYFTITLQTAGEMLAMNYAAWESEEAYFYYKNENYDLAEQSFFHLLKIHEGFEALNKKNGRNIVSADADMSFTYIRLGKIAEKRGQKEKAEEYYKEALNHYQKYCKQIGIEKEYTIQNLLDLIDKIDSKEPAPELRPFSSVLFISQE